MHISARNFGDSPKMVERALLKIICYYVPQTCIKLFYIVNKSNFEKSCYSLGKMKRRRKSLKLATYHTG